MKRKAVLAALTISLACALITLTVPLWVNNPFHVLSSVELRTALGIVRFRPALEVANILLVVGALLVLRGNAAVAAGFILLLTALNHLDIYSLVFHSLDRPEFQAAQDTSLPDTERAIAVSLSGVARAYPVRTLAYHHVVNDRLGGRPIVATY